MFVLASDLNQFHGVQEPFGEAMTAWAKWCDLWRERPQAALYWARAKKAVRLRFVRTLRQLPAYETLFRRQRGAALLRATTERLTLAMGFAGQVTLPHPLETVEVYTRSDCNRFISVDLRKVAGCF